MERSNYFYHCVCVVCVCAVYVCVCVRSGRREDSFWKYLSEVVILEPDLKK